MLHANLLAFHGLSTGLRRPIMGHTFQRGEISQRFSALTNGAHGPGGINTS